VYYQVVHLRDCHPGRIRHALDELPEMLDETYERILRGISKENSEFTHHLLQWVAVAVRPLRVDELAEIFAFDFNTAPIPKFYEDRRLKDPLDAVLSTCSPLLALVNVDDTLIIKFSHFSVKQFLTSARFAEKRDIISRRYHISMTPAHTLMAQACLGILLHLDENVTSDSLGRFPLAEYAAEHWIDHARFEGVSKIVEDGMNQLFDPNKSHLAVWIWMHDPEGVNQRSTDRPERPLAVPPRGTPLHYAALCNLPRVIEFLVVERSQVVNSRAFDDESTPLRWALYGGHVEVARLLIAYDADVEAEDKDESTLLHQAARSGSVEFAHLLVEHDAHATAQDKDGSTPLHQVSRSGSIELARLLIDHGGDVTARDRHVSTPLHQASKMGSIGLVRFLLENFADVTARDEHESTPLHQATPSGSVELVRLLVEHGADVTAQDEFGSTPLQQAFGMGNVELVCFLLERVAHARAQYTPGWTPLHQASKMGNVELVRFLVEHGADVAAQDEHGSTPLHQASEMGSIELACVLIEHGADVTARDSNGSTPLHQALNKQKAELACFLVERGADVTARDKRGLTPLHQGLKM